MPFVQLHTAAPVPPEARRRLGFALAEIYAECMRTDRRIVNVGIVRYGDGDLVRYDAMGGEPRPMTIVTCDGRAGRPPELLEALGRALTETCARELGVSEARVAVYVTQHEAYEIYRDGGRAPGWSAAEGGGSDGGA